MTDENTAAEAGGEGLDVQLAQELVQRARQEGVSLVGPDGLLAGVTRTVLQTALDAEMTEHLGYAKGDAIEHTAGNHRNGTSPKTVHTEWAVSMILDSSSGFSWLGRCCGGVVVVQGLGGGAVAEAAV